MLDNLHPIDQPTYLGHIRFMFEQCDLRCMRRRNIDLGTYQGVRLNAQRIYIHVREGSMPPPSQNRAWSPEKVDTFYNWMRNGTPRGVATITDMPQTESLAERTRRDITLLEPDGDEIAKLTKAFTELMARDPDDPNSYFALAGLHWLPTPGGLVPPSRECVQSLAPGVFDAFRRCSAFRRRLRRHRTTILEHNGLQNTNSFF